MDRRAFLIAGATSGLGSTALRSWSSSACVAVNSPPAYSVIPVVGDGHWIPAHTACYRWFGWTGAHELVLQKGDRLRIPQRGGLFRLIDDWAQWSGKQPGVSYLADLEPLAAEPGADPAQASAASSPRASGKSWATIPWTATSAASVRLSRRQVLGPALGNCRTSPRFLIQVSLSDQAPA